MAPQNPTPARNKHSTGAAPAKWRRVGNRRPTPGSRTRGFRLGPGTAGPGVLAPGASRCPAGARQGIPTRAQARVPPPAPPRPAARARGNLTRDGVLASGPRHGRGDARAPDDARPRAPRRSAGSAVRARGRMAQRLGERARGAAEATGLYRAVLLRSGKCGEAAPPRTRKSARGHGGRKEFSPAPWSFLALSFPSSLPSS